MSVRALPTLAEVSATRRATPKYAMLTKFDRTAIKQQLKRDDAKKLAAWAKQVKALDDWRDRYTGARVKPVGHGVSVTDPHAAHAHHLEPRENEETRYDVRNGITLSASTHDAVERNQLRIVGTQFFRLSGRRYINAREPVRFVKVT